MRPLRSFLLLLIFLTFFIGLHYSIPALKLSPAIDDFLPTELTNYLFSRDTVSPDTGISLKSDIIKFPSPDTILSTDTIPSTDTILSADSISSDISCVAGNLLQGFLDTLSFSKGQIRIMYYGDSQIEGDRITFMLRKILREKHGGTGPGLFLPILPVMYTKSVWLRSSSNWKRYNYLAYKRGKISHLNLGPFMTICRYLPEDVKAVSPEKAYVRIRPSYVADSASSVYDVLRIFYGNVSDVVNISVKADGNIIYADTLLRGNGYNEIGCPLYGATDILIEFEGRVSPDIYGMSIESKKGVIVDNLPQRGSAGLEFTMVDKDNLFESFKKLSPDLIILHYGLNIVRNVRNEYLYYQKGLERQLSLLKEVSPSTPLLVVSLTDMASKKGDSIKSYSNIPVIVNAQKQAATDAGAAFWDSYQSMGGESSIIKWAEKIPPLAQKDYVHFTYPGADTLSRILADDIFSDKATDTNRLKPVKIASEVQTIVQSVPEEVLAYHAEKTTLFRKLITSLFRYNPNEPFIFSSSAYWIFFLLVLAGYSFVYKRFFIRNLYLFLISLFFYYKSGGLFLFLLIFVTLIDFICGLLIFNSRKKYTRRLILIVSIISNLGILAYFKYTGFFVSTINDLLGTDYQVFDFLAGFSNSHFGTSFNISNIILPVGISFFTFQSLSYTFDVYRKKLEPVRNIIDFGFYVSFFPQLVAGPIVRASEFIPQLYSDFQLGKREFSHSVFLILKGLIKKIIISDFIAVNFIDRVFDAPSVYSGFENLMAVYGYGLQIYCDFSGYTDIAIGMALILGFRLPVNFNSPYKAKSVADFWKRWHISLSRWLKDYLYIPMGGNRKGKIRTYLNLLMTMLLGGLWHGASLRFVIWGFLHGAGLVINRFWNNIFGDRLRSNRISRALSVFITFQFVSFCWIFFRAHDMNSVKIMIEQIFKNFSPGSYLTVIPAYSNVFILIAVGYVIHFLPEKVKESYRGLFISIPLIAQLLIAMVVGILLYQMSNTGAMPFIYFRF